MSRINLSPEFFGFFDPGFQESKLLLISAPNNKEREPKIAVVGAMDTGQSNAILPVALELNRRGWEVYGLLRGRAEGIFRSAGFNSSRSVNPLSRVERLKPDAMITGMSSNPDFDATLNAFGRERGIPTFAVEDYPAAYIDSLGEKIRTNPNAAPGILFVMNEQAKEAELLKLEGYPITSDRVLALGQPAFDSIANADKTKIWEEIRNKLGVPKNVDLITWFGQVGKGTVESFKVFLSGLRDLELLDWMLAVRFHPADKENIRVYQELLSPFSRRLIYATSDLVSDANLVIAASSALFQERSTIALQAAAWQVPVGSVVIPQILREHPAMEGLWVPVIEDKTSPLITNLEDMRNVLNGVLLDDDYKRLLQRRMERYKPDGKASERIADEIEARVFLTPEFKDIENKS